MWKVIPAPQAVRYSATGDPKPLDPTTRIDDLESFNCPALYKNTNTNTTNDMRSISNQRWGSYNLLKGKNETKRKPLLPAKKLHKYSNTQEHTNEYKNCLKHIIIDT